MPTQPVTPYSSDASKNHQIRDMFNRISKRYDILNTVLSLGIHRYWRKSCIREIKLHIKPKTILDVATGTGDFALACLQLHPDKITGMDISRGMLDVGINKLRQLKIPNTKIELIEDNAETTSMFNQHFDLIVVAFGVRNFENLNRGLANMHRMLKPNGVLCVLEFAYPQKNWLRHLYHFYFKRIVPLIGRICSADEKAYTYLFNSVQSFPHFDAFTDHLRETGFSKTYYKALSFGISSCYIGIKKTAPEGAVI